MKKIALPDFYLQYNNLKPLYVCFRNILINQQSKAPFEERADGGGSLPISNMNFIFKSISASQVMLYKNFSEIKQKLNEKLSDFIAIGTLAVNKHFKHRNS